MKYQIGIIGPKDRIRTEQKNVVFNVTSQSREWTKCFSPFLLGPVTIAPGGLQSINVENAWQFSKVYEEDYDKVNKTPKSSYWKWAASGWATKRAFRYPKGRRKPMCVWWNGKEMGYIEARKEIYIPLYTQAVLDRKTDFANLISMVKRHIDEGFNVYFWDFDGYNHYKMNLTYDQIVNDPSRPLGHAFVLAYMVENVLNKELLTNNE